MGNRLSSGCGRVDGTEIQEMNVREKSRRWLYAHGYDGLYNRVLECGCTVEDFEPCEGRRVGCRPGSEQPAGIGRPNRARIVALRLLR